MRSRKSPLLLWLMVCCGAIVAACLAARPAESDVGSCHPAELFATDNTAVITDPDLDTAGQLQDGLGLFELQADATIAQNGAVATGSTLLDGVSWSTKLHQATYERSREFHLCAADEPTLHAVAGALRHQFNQRSVLTFDYLPRDAPGADAVIIAVPNVDIAHLRAALVTDSAALRRLLGASVTTTDHTLILVVGNGDLDVARRLVGKTGGSWNAAAIAYGKREFVD